LVGVRVMYGKQMSAMVIFFGGWRRGGNYPGGHKYPGADVIHSYLHARLIAIRGSHALQMPDATDRVRHLTSRDIDYVTLHPGCCSSGGFRNCASTPVPGCHPLMAHAAVGMRSRHAMIQENARFSTREIKAPSQGMN